MGNIAGHGKGQIPGRRKMSGSFGLGFGESLRAGQSSSGVWAWTTHFSFQRKLLRVLCGHFEHQRRAQFEKCVAEPLQTITPFVFGSKWSCLVLCIVLQDALGEVTNFYPLLKLRMFVDDITVFKNGRNEELVEMAEKFSEEVEERGREEWLDAVDH